MTTGQRSSADDIIVFRAVIGCVHKVIFDKEVCKFLNHKLKVNEWELVSPQFTNNSFATSSTGTLPSKRSTDLHG